MTEKELLLAGLFALVVAVIASVGVGAWLFGC